VRRWRRRRWGCWRWFDNPAQFIVPTAVGWVMRKTFLVILVLLGLPDRGFGCFCNNPALDSAHVATYDFIAVVRVHEVSGYDNQRQRIWSRSSITRSFKGGRQDGDFVLMTSLSSCGLDLEEVGSWMVYGKRLKGDTVFVNLCSRSQPMRDMRRGFLFMNGKNNASSNYLDLHVPWVEKRKVRRILRRG
jgi:hypothetical protein